MSAKQQHSYMADYGGPLVPWPGDKQNPDWAALFPIPVSQLIDKRPRKMHSRTVRSQEDRFYSGDDDGGEFWLSPRIACMLHQAGCVYIDVHCDEMQLQEDLPACVQPYAQQEEWQEAYRQAAMRLVARLEKGLPPHPNCTAEEMALHKIIEAATDDYNMDEDGFVTGLLEPLPCSTKDDDFDMVSELAFEDHDVLMLFSNPNIINSSVAAMMDFAHLHPRDWFKPFNPGRINDHVPIV